MRLSILSLTGHRYWREVEVELRNQVICIYDRLSRRLIRSILLSAIKAVVAFRHGIRLVSGSGHQLASIRAENRDVAELWIKALFAEKLDAESAAGYGPERRRRDQERKRDVVEAA